MSVRKAPSFCRRKDCYNKGKTRIIRSCIGDIKITNKQASPLGIELYRGFSPLREKCCLLLAANESFQDPENDLKVLIGIEFGYSKYHRQVEKVDLSRPNVKQKLTEVCLDGEKVRLRSQEKGKPTY
jgi:hypothetical protein